MVAAVLILALLVHNGLCAEYPRWLTDNQVILESKALTELVMIESHDAGTYDLKGFTHRPDNDVYAPDDNNLFIDIGASVTSGVIIGWSRSQYQTVYEQLNSGIRSIDIRVCADKNGTLLTCHGLYGATIEEILSDVSKFATENPKEFLLLSFNAFHGWNQDTPGQLSDEKHKELQALISEKLSGVMVDHTKIDKPTIKLSAMWAMQDQNKFGSVIITYGDASNPGYWSGDLQEGTWLDTWNYTTKKESLIRNLANADKTKLTAFSGAATPDANLVILGFNEFATRFFHYPTSLRELADNTNPTMLGWILNDQMISKGRIGMVGMDFVNTTCAIELALMLNGIPNISLAMCNIGTETYWDKWHALYPCPPPLADHVTFLYCEKPTAYTRPGYPWKVGDKAFDLSAAKARCEKDWGVGKCELNGAIYYPICKSSYHNVGCCVCSFNCPDQMTDVGALCQK